MSDSGEKKIKITMDGPYEVSGNINLNQAFIRTNEAGESVAWQPGAGYQDIEGPYKLCRCGHSSQKPFCDGSHDDVGFCGHEFADRPPYRMHAEVRLSEDCTLLDDPTLCAGARFCDRGGSVWNLVENSGDPRNKALAISEACDCPSGRLTVVDRDGGVIESRLRKEISLIEDPINDCRGPLWIKGGIAIEGAGGEKYETRNRVTLCRCGESKNQPFCDGQHYNCQHMRGLDERK